MSIFLDFGLAWISVVLGFLLSIIYVLRIIIKKFKKTNSTLAKIHKNLRKCHIVLGVMLIITGLVHGIYSSIAVLSLNIGTLCWIVSILLGLSWLIRKKLSKASMWIKIHRVLTAVFIVLIIWHIVDVGGIQIFDVISSYTRTIDEISNNNTQNNNNGQNSNQNYTYDNRNDVSDDKSSNNNENNDNDNNTNNSSAVIDEINKTLEYGAFKDGVYTGTATGYGDGLTVQIELKDNKIISLDIISHNERNSNIYQKAFDGVTEEILEEQSVEVDTVSGATFSSIGIMNAVNNALSEALVDGTLPDNQSLPANNHKRH